MNFGEVWRAQLAKSTLRTSTLVPMGYFQIFKVYSDAKCRVGCGKQREATAPIQSLVKLQPWFLSLRWKTCLRQNYILGSCVCSEGSALGQNTLMMMMKYEYLKQQADKLNDISCYQVNSESVLTFNLHLFLSFLIFNM